MAESAPNPPNVLLIVLDAVRPDHLSCYGCERPTSPALEELCRDATRYTRGYSTSAWTPPSHASLFTGLYPSRHGVVDNLHLPPDVPTLAEMLRQAGYHTAGIANMFHVSRQRGFARGFDHYATPFDLQTVRLPLLGERSWELSAEFVSYALRRAIWRYDASWRNMLKAQRQMRAGGDRPFFIFVNLNSAHSPYRPPKPFEGRFVGRDDLAGLDMGRLRWLARRGGYQFLVGATEVSEREWQVLRGWYDEEIAYVDSLVGRLVARLRHLGRYDDTLIVVTADHGEQFGEHGRVYHAFSLYEPAARVPLIVKWPRPHADGRAGTSEERLASLADVLPTVCDVAGVAAPEELDGRSLLAQPDHGRPVFGEYCPSEEVLHLAEHFAGANREVLAGLARSLQAVWQGDDKLILGSDGSLELYDLAADPGEERELSAAEPGRAARLRDLIRERLLPPAEWPQAGSEQHDERVRRHLQALGYL